MVRSLPTLQLTDFSGPLELLLHLIKKNQMDIFNVSIVQVTNQYIDFIENAEKLNLPIIGEYYVMASTLMKLKAYSLLPITEQNAQDTEDNEKVRKELKQRLLEYQRYQPIFEYLKKGERLARKQFTIPPVKLEKKTTVLIIPSKKNVKNLANAYIYRLRQQNKHLLAGEVTVHWQYSIKHQSELIRTRLKMDDAFYFKTLPHHDRQALVTNFLSILEMSRSGEVHLSQTLNTDILITKRGQSDE